MMRWYQRLFRRERTEKHLDAELRFHLEQQIADYVASGMAPEEARRRARLEFGGLDQVKEECRDVGAARFVETLIQDVRYGLRQLRRNPGFTAAAVITLALGIGTTTVMFSIVSGVVLKPLPYPSSGRLVTIHEETSWKTQYGNQWAFAYPNFLDCQRESRSLDMAAWRYAGGVIREAQTASYIDALQISSNLFAVLGVPVFRGRAFRPEDDRPGAPPVIIISHDLWQRVFAGNLAAIGQSVVFEGEPYTVVGIMPSDFRLNGELFQAFVPLGQNTQPYMHNRGAHPRINVWARLRPGVTLAGARADLALIGRRLAAQYPKSNAGRTFVTEPLRPDIGNITSALWLLTGAVGVVLLIACVNVASLLLARAVSRERELAMRAALGASRSRLVRQCLTESLLLGLCGGSLGILFAAVGLRPFIRFWPHGLPRAQEVQLDWHVLLFALGASMVCGLLFGLAPAFRVPVRDIERKLRAGARNVAGDSRRLHSYFVIAEVALAFVLLVSAGILGRTLLQLSSVNPGFDAHHVLVARVSLAPSALETPARLRAAWRNVLADARGVSGVESAALVDTVPMREGINELGYWTSPAAPRPDRMPLAVATAVSPDYLKVMGILLREGRFFNEEDRTGSEPVVVVDQEMARRAFGESDPVGKMLWIDAQPWLRIGPARVVGVVDHVRQWGLAGGDRSQASVEFYYPFAQVPDGLLGPFSKLMSIAVRTRVTPMAVIGPLRRAVSGGAGDQALSEVRTMEQLSSGSIAQQRFLMLLFGVFAALALVLAYIGIYGVLAYLTRQRVPEFGVRVALGAHPTDVIRLVLGQSIRMIFTGMVLGVPAAVAAGRVLKHLVLGVRSIDPLTIGMMVSVLVATAVCASFLPARHAARVDPVVALRQE